MSVAGMTRFLNLWTNVYSVGGSDMDDFMSSLVRHRRDYMSGNVFMYVTFTRFRYTLIHNSFEHQTQVRRGENFQVHFRRDRTRGFDFSRVLSGHVRIQLTLSSVRSVLNHTPQIYYEYYRITHSYHYTLKYHSLMSSNVTKK